MGSGNHGLIGLTLSPEVYKAHTSVDWTVPTNPGVTPNYAVLTEVMEIEEASRKLDEKRVCHDHNNTDMALKVAPPLLFCKSAIFSSRRTFFYRNCRRSQIMVQNAVEG